MDHRSEVRNLVFFVTVILAAVSVGFFGYYFPKTILAVSTTVITSISIIFGLSLSLITLASGKVEVSELVVPRDETRRGVVADVERENERIIFRQKLSVFIMMLSIVFGVIFIGSENFAPDSIWCAIIGAIFAFFTTLSFAISFVLPFSISNTLRRERYLRSSGRP